MPFFDIDGGRLFYRLEGSKDRPVLVLSNSLGTDHSLWAPQMAQLLDYFQVLRYDLRGHGASETVEGDYSIDQLGRDVLSLVNALGIGRFFFCGLSLGGMIGQWLSTHAPDRIAALILANTSAKVGPKTMWEERRRSVCEYGMQSIVDRIMRRFFSTDRFVQTNPFAASVRSVFLAMDPAGYAACCAAIRDMDQTETSHLISVPALLIVGDRDTSTPWNGHGEFLAARIPNIRVVRLPAAHLTNIERPRSFTHSVLDFLLQQRRSGDTLTGGDIARRSALGDDHVDRARDNTTEFTREFQEVITRFAWGTIWARPGIERHSRRLLALTALAALGRWEEFRMHVRAGLELELEPCDLQEALLQLSVYSGLPAANEGFRIANEELSRWEIDGQHSGIPTLTDQ
jgi:3-oxoadipate enol-lactonase / 4-carboxymuconolactone decarboxylase